MWCGVGIMLCSLAYGWLNPLDWGVALALAGSGALLALAILLFGFSRLAIRNIHRIDRYLGDKVCMFAFQQWYSYPLIVVMVSLGIFLRKYSPIPKPLLGVLYIGIGGSLFAAGLLYFLRLMKGNDNPTRV